MLLQCHDGIKLISRFKSGGLSGSRVTVLAGNRSMCLVVEHTHREPAIRDMGGDDTPGDSLAR